MTTDIAEAPTTSPRPPTLRRRAVKGSIWTVVWQSGMQALRLGSHLILARLLTPEVFGLMALVGAVQYGLQMLSDMGVGPAVTQHARGADPAFLRTAWTFDAVRGLALWGVACLLAWPVSVFFEQPALAALIPVACFAAALHGLSSPVQYTAVRNMSYGRVTTCRLVSQAAGVTVMIAWAVRSPTPWSMVAGGLSASATYAALTHVLLRGPRIRFGWSPEAARDIFGFGKWIFFTSALYFAAKQGDRLILGKTLPLDALGVYAIAVYLTDALGDTAQAISRNVLFPALAHVHRSRASEVRAAFAKARAKLDLTFVPAAGFLAGVGGVLVAAIYDDRYRAAGWAVQILSIRIALRAMSEPCEACLVASGRPRYVFVAHCGRTAWTLAGGMLGWKLAGLPGVVWAVAFSETPALLVFWWAMRRHGYLRARTEVRAVGVFVLSALIGLACAAGAVRVWPSLDPNRTAVHSP